MLEINFEQFVPELDAAIQAHMEWSHRVLRCAVLHASPGDDVLNSQAHTLCRFGRWFTEHRKLFDVLDVSRAREMEVEHQAMHDAIRAICSRVLAGQLGNEADLDAYEISQTRFVDHLTYFKTQIITRSSQIDSLTGLPLRHRIAQDFDLLRRHSRRHGSVLAVMMVDADYFKNINDQYGHGIGDMVLQSLARTLRGALRDEDLAYRYGGDEFLLLMEMISVDDAEIVPRRMLEAVHHIAITLPDGSPLRQTVSIGIALASEGEDLKTLIRQADEALYDVKAAGRNAYRTYKRS
ncbi:MAG: diguanylate cyclase [Burkholderiales bacterium]|nr:diguanylate cyclase [Burkholderiales bacterium]